MSLPIPFILTKGLLASAPMFLHAWCRPGLLPGFRPVYMANQRGLASGHAIRCGQRKTAAAHEWRAFHVTRAPGPAFARHSDARRRRRRGHRASRARDEAGRAAARGGRTVLAHEAARRRL